MRAPQGFRPRFGELQITHFALLDQPFHRSHGVFNRHRGIDAVQAVDVDDIHAEHLQTFLARLGHVIGMPAAQRGRAATGAVVGERWKIGLDVELEVTSPRTPCATFQQRFDEPRFVKRFTEAGRVGAYLRVIRTGSIQAGDHIHRFFVPNHGITVGKWFSEPDLESMELLRDADADREIRLQQPEFDQKFEALLRRSRG